MINSIQTKNTLTFLLLNTVELLSATWFIFSTIRLFSIKYWSFDGGQTFNVACILACLVVCFVVLLSLFGFLTSYKSNSKMYLAYGILLLLCLLLQTITAFTARKSRDELMMKKIKYNDLPYFTLISEDLRVEIQEIQQTYDCCGLDKERGFENYYDVEKEKNPDRRIPDSCCGKYDKRALVNIGHCSYEEYSRRKGCSYLLLGIYKKLFGNTTFDYQHDIGIVFVVLFNIFQVTLAGFSIYIYLEMSIQEKAQRRAIYKPGE